MQNRDGFAHCQFLSGGYPLLFGLIIIPPFLRNWVYDYIACNRYKWCTEKGKLHDPNTGIEGEIFIITLNSPK